MDEADNKSNSFKWYEFVPLFIIGFLLLSLVRTLGDTSVIYSGKAFWLLNDSTWESLYSYVSSFGTTYLLGMAMAGIGLSTDFKMFKGLGITPLIIGFVAMVSVGIVSMILVGAFGHLINI